MKAENSAKLAIVCTHPIQYYSPWFRYLAEQAPRLGAGLGLRKESGEKFQFEVFYAHKQTSKGQAEAGFGVEFEWDVPLLQGYPSRFLKNISKQPSTDTFGGCDCPEIGTILKKEGFTHLLCIGWYAKVFWQAIVSAKSAGIRVLSRGDSQLGMQNSPVKKLLKEIVYRPMLRLFDAHLYVGHRNYEYLRHYGVPESRLFFSPHFVDNEWWAANAERSRIGYGISDTGYGSTPISNILNPISEKRTTFLFAGKFIPKKRVSDLLEAAARVPEARVVLVGDGPLRGELEARAAKSDLAGRVEFVGFKNQRELPAYLAAADCLVLPSDGTETWGLIINEGMASGKPAIVSQACGCEPNLIEQGITGYSFPEGNIEVFAQCMRDFVTRKNINWPKQVHKKIGNYSKKEATVGLCAAMKLKNEQNCA